MSDVSLNAASLAYADAFTADGEVIVAARERAAELGCPATTAAAGAALRLLATTTGARAVVEVGTGGGVAALYLLDGMAEDGVLTTIDVEGEHQRAAKEAFTQAQIAPARYRLINGSAPEVLPRLRDGAYDVVVVDADPTSYSVYLDQALRLLRRGGVVVFDNALGNDRVADPAQRDPQTTVLRELVKAVRDDERFVSALLAVGGGLLVAAKR